MSKFCESTYEEAFIDLLEQNGWEYTCGDDLHRKLDETIIEDDLRDYLSRKYADEALADDEIDATSRNLPCSQINGDRSRRPIWAHFSTCF